MSGVWRILIKGNDVERAKAYAAEWDLTLLDWRGAGQFCALDVEIPDVGILRRWHAQSMSHSVPLPEGSLMHFTKVEDAEGLLKNQYRVQDKTSEEEFSVRMDERPPSDPVDQLAHGTVGDAVKEYFRRYGVAVDVSVQRTGPYQYKVDIMPARQASPGPGQYSMMLDSTRTPGAPGAEHQQQEEQHEQN